MSGPCEPEMPAVEEIEPLPTRSPSSQQGEIDDQSLERPGLSRSQALELYTSHLLSTWNARSYEFAAIVFTAVAYPDTLVASSLRGIFTTAASICFSASLGHWIDHSPNRLTTLLSTITANRVSVIAACALWAFIVHDGSVDLNEPALLSDASPLRSSNTISGLMKHFLFVAIIVIGVLERLSGTANMMSMERDWVVTVAAPHGQPYDLTHLNAVMRRIDLICKLIAPIVVSVIISATTPVRLGVLFVGGMSVASWVVEWGCARRVWTSHSALQVMKILRTASNSPSGEQITGVISRDEILRLRDNSLLENIRRWVNCHIQDLQSYLSSQVWVPSLALSLLHLSVLSYSATFITYLLNVGFSLNHITIARAVGSIVEISSTVVTPLGVDYLGKAHHHRYHHSHSPECINEGDDAESALLPGTAQQHGNTETGLERLGLWGITWQLLTLVPVVLSLWAISPHPSSSSPAPSSSVSASTLNPPAPSLPTSLVLTIFTFLSLSRLGLWIYDLTTQQLTQTLVPAASRSSFAGVENSFVSLFELGQNVFGIVLSRPDQFGYLAVGSWAAVAVSAVMYASWVRGMRGHLVHWDRLGKGCDCILKGRRS